jgi:serine protease AprX
MVLVALVALLVPVTASAAPGQDNGVGNDIKAFVTPSLLGAAEANPTESFDVIVQGSSGRSSNDVATDVLAASPGNPATPKRFESIAGVEATLLGRQVVQLAHRPTILAITPNAPVRLTSTNFSNNQKWTNAVGAPKLWDQTSGLAAQPTIAIVDSGVDSTRTADFGGRVIKQVTMTSLLPNSPGDGRGHGTFVASIAAGAAKSYSGVAPTAKLLSIDVTDDSGMAMTSDVIAAADWILQNQATYNIRVANFSLQASNPGTFMFDPLNKAVERLWFGGVVVVAAAGNYGNLGTGVPFAPADDPFVITVGAADINATNDQSDDFAAPWSASGYTLDGFAKPELGAPGRYMIGAVPTSSTLTALQPLSVVAPGYMQLSGTSFAAPVVAGIAAELLALHPDWTPDQVKGALMLSASPTAATGLTLGVGEVNAGKALGVTSPPNPNLALDSFLVADPNGGSVPVFDTASWTSAASLNASWTSASWTSASWTSASWTLASWTSASWTSASWTSASWTSASWTSASWTSASWTSASWTSASWTSSLSNAGDFGPAPDGYSVTDPTTTSSN